MCFCRCVIHCSWTDRGPWNTSSQNLQSRETWVTWTALSRKIFSVHTWPLYLFLWRWTGNQFSCKNEQHDKAQIFPFMSAYADVSYWHHLQHCLTQLPSSDLVLTPVSWNSVINGRLEVQVWLHPRCFYIINIYHLWMWSSADHWRIA